MPKFGLETSLLSSAGSVGSSVVNAGQSTLAGNSLGNVLNQGATEGAAAVLHTGMDALKQVNYFGTKIPTDGELAKKEAQVKAGLTTALSSNANATNNLLKQTGASANAAATTKMSSDAANMLAQSSMLMSALQVPTPEKIHSLQWDLTDDYYDNKVIPLSDKIRGNITAVDKTLDTIVAEYYQTLQKEADNYLTIAEKLQKTNNDTLTEYWTAVKKLTTPKLQGDKLIQNTLEYYGAVRVLSLAFIGYAETFRIGSTRGDTHGRKTDKYYKKVQELSTTTIDSLKKQYLKDAKVLLGKEWVKNFSYGSDNYKTVQSAEFSNSDLQNVAGSFIDGTLNIKPDQEEGLPDNLQKISDDSLERWNLYHSYDTMSPEMRMAILNTAGNINPDIAGGYTKQDVMDMTPNDLAEKTFPKLGKPLVTHNKQVINDPVDPSNPASYMNRDSYIVKAEGSTVSGETNNLTQSVLAKGLTVPGDSKISSKLLTKVTVYNDKGEPAGKQNQYLVTSPAKPYTNYLEEILRDAKVNNIGAYRFFIEKLHGKYDKGGFYKKNPVRKETTDKRGMQTVADIGNRMVFPAFVSAFSDSFDTDWEGYNFVGRSEKFGVYKTTNRTLTLSFYMLSDYSAELLQARAQAGEMAIAGTSSAGDVKKALQNYFIDWGSGTYDLPKIIEGQQTGFVPGQYSGTTEMMWARMTFLAQCNYPWFRNDGKLKEQPIVRVRIGDFLDLSLRIKSMNMTEYDSFNMDLTGHNNKIGAYPMGVKCDITADIIHSEEPGSEYLKFYHRLDYDTDDNKKASSNQVLAAAVTKNKPEAKPSEKATTETTGSVGGPNSPYVFKYKPDPLVLEPDKTKTSKFIADSKTGGGLMNNSGRVTQISGQAQTYDAGSINNGTIINNGYAPVGGTQTILTKNGQGQQQPIAASQEFGKIKAAPIK